MDVNIPQASGQCTSSHKITVRHHLERVSEWVGYNHHHHHVLLCHVGSKTEHIPNVQLHMSFRRRVSGQLTALVLTTKNKVTKHHLNRLIPYMDHQFIQVNIGPPSVTASTVARRTYRQMANLKFCAVFCHNRSMHFNCITQKLSTYEYTSADTYTHSLPLDKGEGVCRMFITLMGL